MKTIILQIEKIVAGGFGLGRLPDGLVTLVPYVLSGESVAVEILKRRKGYADARLVEVIKPSFQRIIPACPYFEKCGGCGLQHMSYPCQVETKGQILADELSRNLAGDHLQEGVLAEFAACAVPFNYRQRIRLQVDEFGRLGFYANRSHAVVEIESCSLAMPALNQVLALLLSNIDIAKILQHSTAVELWFSPAEQQVVLLITLSRKPRPADRQVAAKVAGDISLLQSIWLRAEGAALEGPFTFTDKDNIGKAGGIGFSLACGHLSELQMRFETGGFCQVNLAQNEELVDNLLDWASLTGSERVLDLYCGMGNFSLPLALQAREVVGTDVQRSSIRSAERNATHNAISNIRFLRSDGLQALKSFAGKEQFDLLVLDPPRRGCKEIITALPELGVSKIIYISCDPATLIRDLNLLQAVGFQLIKIKGFDMFPQTPHMETMAMLQVG